MLKRYTEYTGTEFNAHHHLFRENTKFYKFLNNEMIHNGFEYHLGLNIDTNQFDPTGKCTGRGLYFCEKSDCHLYYQYGTKLALIEIPNDARVYIEKYKFKADRLIIKEIIDIDNDFWVDILSKDGTALAYVEKQTEHMCIVAVQQNGKALCFVKSQFLTGEIFELAVQQNGLVLEQINKQTYNLCKLAVQQNGLALKYVQDRYQTEELCFLAVKQNQLALQFVKESFLKDELYVLAVQQDGIALQCETESISLSSGEILESEVLKRDFALKYVKKQKEYICKFAVMQNGNALRHVKDQTNEICILAVQQRGAALEYVKNQTEEICIQAVQQNGLALQFVKKQTEEICIKAALQNIRAMKFVEPEFKSSVIYLINLHNTFN